VATISLALSCTGQVGNPAVGAGASGDPIGAGGRSGDSTGPGTGSVPGTGAGSTGGSNSPPGVGAGGATVPSTAAGNPTSAGLRPLRLLSTREYLNTARDLLADAGMSAEALPSDNEDPASSFSFHTRGDVATLDASLFRDAAQGLAARAVTHLGTLLPCSTSVTTTNEAACVNTFMSTLALRMYRRPLTASDKTGLMGLYTVAKGAAPTGLGLGFGDSIGFVIEAILQSPEFLYHWEIDSGKASVDTMAPAGITIVKMGGYEMANRLSYFLWGSMPDQALFDAAAAGTLGDATSVEAQARRMLKDPKASAMFADFFVDWLDIDTLASKPKDKILYPTYGDALAASMNAEVQSFVSSIMTSGSGRFDDLMTGTKSFANAALANVYGLSGVTGTTLQPVTLNPAQRSGLLTTPAFMALTGASDGSLPPRRGAVILKKLLCRTLPPPPAVIPDPKPVTPGVTTRQRFEEHSSNPCATACHTMIDPLGFAFENYDGIGQYRMTDNALPVNAQVSLTLDGKLQTVADARGLVTALAGSNEAQSCFSRQWFRYALGRLDTADDLASVNGATATFKSATRDVRELLVGIATSRTFRYRALSQGEVVQ
jgi:Protein of unknown function (DUF1592)/Protein of unknown function (DUF1588)/Protein of unknown function (DUF1595)/Protein of unknown function (DUF1585)/Protein of unknown function (DUF1587)